MDTLSPLNKNYSKGIGTYTYHIDITKEKYHSHREVSKLP